MKFNKFLSLLFFFALNCQFVFAEDLENNSPSLNLNQQEKANTDFIEGRCHHHRRAHRHHSNKCLNSCLKRCQLGSASFFVTNPELWYTVETSPFPISTMLTLNRNGGTVQGDVQLTPNGLFLGEAGNYMVSYSIVMLNNLSLDPGNLVAFLVVNDVFDPMTGGTLIASVGMVPFQVPSTIQGSGILHNVPAGSTISVIGTNTGDTLQTFSIANWSIQAFKIPCDSNPIVL